MASHVMMETPLVGWTDFHFRGLVLVGTSPEGREWSMGELVPSVGRPALLEQRQRVSRLVILDPDGSTLLEQQLRETIAQEAWPIVLDWVRDLGGTPR
jgi:hypothetical protein